jgi:hypothetical protein
MTKPQVIRRKKSAPKDLRDQAILKESLAGKSNNEIAETLGISYQHVSKVLNSEEVKAIVRQGESDITSTISESIMTLADALACRYTIDGEGNKRLNLEGMGHALKAAFAVLKNAGLLRDSIDINHNMIVPYVIQRHDGSQVVLGAKKDGEK